MEIMVLMEVQEQVVQEVAIVMEVVEEVVATMEEAGGGAGCSGGGGSGYIGGVSNGSMSNGQRSGNGYATITLVE